jgi:hypothetical protein
MFDWKGRKGNLCKKKKKHRISPFQKKKPNASEVMDCVTPALSKSPPPQSLPFIPGNHEERTSPNKSEQVRILTR